MATVASIAEEVATELGEGYGDPDVGSQFDNWVIQAIGELFDTAEWSFALTSTTFPSVAGTAQYDLSTTIATVRSAVDGTDGVALLGTTLESLLLGGTDLTDSGIPYLWYVSSFDSTDGSLKLSLWPVPTSVRTYTVHGTKSMSSLTSASVLPIPGDVSRAVKSAVRALYYENAEYPDALTKADRWRGQYEQALVGLRSRYLHHAGVDFQIRFGDIARNRMIPPGPRFPPTIEE